MSEASGRLNLLSGIAMGAAMAFMLPRIRQEIQRRANFDQLLATIQAITAASNADMDQLRIALTPELEAWWIDEPGRWAYYAACEGKTIAQLLKIIELSRRLRFLRP